MINSSLVKPDVKQKNNYLFSERYSNNYKAPEEHSPNIDSERLKYNNDHHRLIEC